MVDELVSVIALGILQGVAEFFPISSSGHVATLGLFLPRIPMTLPFVVALHMGTLAATIIVFWRDIVAILLRMGKVMRPQLRTRHTMIVGNMPLNIAVASLATAIIGLALRDRVNTWMHSPQMLGLFFCVTATALLTIRLKHPGQLPLGWKEALLIGIAQGIAVIPGISRSGSTIVCALLLGLPAIEAFRFSFLISIPAILGATLLEALGPVNGNFFNIQFMIGALSALGTGYIALRILRNMLVRGHFWWFSLYLYPLGCFLLWWGRNTY